MQLRPPGSCRGNQVLTSLEQAGALHPFQQDEQLVSLSARWTGGFWGKAEPKSEIFKLQTCRSQARRGWDCSAGALCRTEMQLHPGLRFPHFWGNYCAASYTLCKRLQRRAALPPEPGPVLGTDISQLELLPTAVRNGFQSYIKKKKKKKWKKMKKKWKKKITSSLAKPPRKFSRRPVSPTHPLHQQGYYYCYNLRWQTNNF